MEDVPRDHEIIDADTDFDDDGVTDVQSRDVSGMRYLWSGIWAGGQKRYHPMRWSERLEGVETTWSPAVWGAGVGLVLSRDAVVVLFCAAVAAMVHDLLRALDLWDPVFFLALGVTCAALLRFAKVPGRFAYVVVMFAAMWVVL